MKEIQLTQGYVALVDDEDFERVNQFKWSARVETRKDGSVRNVYAFRNVIGADGKRHAQYMHRLIMNVTDPEVQVDHSPDHSGLNNLHANLRLATNTENGRNKRINVNNTSGVKGVVWHKKNQKWVAEIKVNRQYKALGSFTSLADAKHAYDEAAVKYFGAFACTNNTLVQESHSRS